MITEKTSEVLQFHVLPKNSLVSILMPAFNAAEFISVAIESTIDQSYVYWELLILDDASIDDTMDVVNSFNDKRIRLFKHQKNQGYLESCNELFDHAKGDLITFLDADDLQPNNRLQLCVNTFQNDVNLGFISTAHERLNRNGKHLRINNSSIDYTRYETDPSYFPYLACATIMIRKEMLKQVGGYHDFFKGMGGEDYHWLFKLSQHTNGIHITDVLYQYRQHDKQNQNLLENPLKYFFPDINIQIRQELIENENDLLSDPELLKNRWEQYTSQNPYEVQLRKAQHLINRDQLRPGLDQGFRLLRDNILSLKSWVDFIRMGYSILYRAVT